MNPPPSSNQLSPRDTTGLRVGYIVKRYPRFSETFVVNEILAHEAAGHALEIFSLHPPNDTHFQDLISRVRAPVTYLGADHLRASDLWSELQALARVRPSAWAALADADLTAAREVGQAAALARLVVERGLGHLHAHFASSATSVARLAARWAGISYSFTAHAKDIFHREVDDDDLRQKLADAYAAVTVSEYNVAHLRRRFGPDARHVRRIYNGMHLDRFGYTSPAERPPRILGVGRLIEKKGFDVLVDAARVLADRGVAFECDIIGTGEWHGLLAERIVRLGLDRQVRLLGALPQGDVIQHLRDAAVMAAPCVVGADGNADGLPTVLLEAMALGTPCVATPVTGIPEVVHHEQTGLLVGERDVPALADALHRLLHDGVLRERLARRARALVASRFDVGANAADLFRVFQDAVVTRESSPDFDAPVDPVPSATPRHVALTAPLVRS